MKYFLIRDLSMEKRVGKFYATSLRGGKRNIFKMQVMFQQKESFLAKQISEAETLVLFADLPLRSLREISPYVSRKAI